MVLDLEDSPQVLIILGMPFLATVEAVIDVQAGTMSFQLCGERVDFCFPLHTTSLAAHPSSTVTVCFAPSATVSRIVMSDGGGGPRMRFIAFSDLPLPNPYLY